MYSMRQSLVGMTLVELLITITIISLLAILSIPPFRALQARQSLRTADRSIQSMLYRLQQQSLAPPDLNQSDYDVIGYGMALVKLTPGAKTVSLLGCTLEPKPTNDFVASVKYARLHDAQGTIVPLPNSATPPNCVTPLTIKGHSDDFYVLPSEVTFIQPDATWLVPLALRAAGDAFGPLPQGDLPNPLDTTGGTNTVILQSTTARVQGQPICHGVTFSRTTSGVDAVTTALKDCRG